MRLFRKNIIFLGSVIFSCATSIAFTTFYTKPKEVSAKLVSTQKVFEAGETISLDFELNTPVKTTLFLHTSFGSASIDPVEPTTTRFVIPNFIARKKGKISYKLIYESEVLVKGMIDVIANTRTEVSLESYIGPPSIVAGGKDYTMHVVIPTDAYDNPFPDSTVVAIKHQFMKVENENTLYSKDMIAWKNIFSYKQSGRLLLFSKVGETASKEFSVEMYPALPEDFVISSDRKHVYADGNQIAELSTSIIKDMYGNVVSDGTLVQFVIKDASGAILQTQGSTLYGKAVARVLHPDHKDTWQIKAYVYGMAESNELTLSYQPIIDDFEVKFAKENREIVVGPLVSFMQQLIPDGATVKLMIFKEQKKIDTKISTSSNGKVRFLLKDGFYEAGIYDIHISALGVQKKYKKVLLQ
ncbi:hypothetical protein ABW636_08900 [Aquimarina sp. 2201CG1-2-11]|uniref:hypothetical protein n=1 Tax=Aquimarina discodermiae TaxID=3231043 RepID=UPI0034636587